MLYVLARSQEDFRVWQTRTGIPTTVLYPITTPEAARGISIDHRDIIRLDGFYLNPRAEQIFEALIPTGIQLSKIRIAAVIG